MAQKEALEMDFKKTLLYARRLEEVAAELKKTATGSFEDSLSVTKIAWKCETSDLFYKKGMLMHQSIICSSENLLKIAEDIRSCAKRIYDAEMKALDMAWRRTY